jgi:hypothetical protein
MDVVSTQRPPGSDQHGAMSFVPASGRVRRADHPGGGADVWISLPTGASDDAHPASAVS